MKKRIRTLTMGSILVLHLSSCQESLDYNFYDLKKIEPPVIKTLSSNENDIDEKLNTIISTILDIIPSMYNDNTRCGLSTQRHTHLAVGGFRVLAPKPYLHVSMYTAFH